MLMKSSYFRLKLVAGATALLGAVLVSGCATPSSSMASCCGGKPGEVAVAGTETALVTPEVAQASIEAEPMLVAQTPAERLTTLRANLVTMKDKLQLAPPDVSGVVTALDAAIAAIDAR